MIQSEFNEAQRRRKLYAWSINQTKDFLQNLAIHAWLIMGGIGVILAFTGFGKTVLATKIIKKFLKKYPDDKVIIVVPSLPLYKQWKLSMEKFGKSVELYVINTYTMNDHIDRNCGLFIVDEIQHAAGEDSKYFSTAFGITTYRRALGLSATMTKQELAFLQGTYGLQVAWDITLEEGKALEILPKYLVCNLGIELTEGEKATYFQVNHNYTHFLNKFSTAHSEKAWELAMACSKGNLIDTTIKVGRFGAITLNSIGWREYVIDQYADLGIIKPENKQVFLWARDFKRAMDARNAIIYRSVYKHRMMLFLLKNIQKNIMVFTTTTKILHWWRSDETTEYHSHIKPAKLKEQNLKDFCVSKRIMLSCSALKEGYDNKKVEVIINHDYTSKVRDLEQIIGRALRPDEDNPEKSPLVINLFCKRFIYQEQEIIPQDSQRLEKAQQRLHGVETLELDELMARV